MQTPRSDVVDGYHGTLGAACLIQRPEPHCGGVCQEPVVDMPRYHRFAAGRFWVPGTAMPRPTLSTSASSTPPPAGVTSALVTSADSDDRVVPAHANKSAATLQEAYDGPSSIPLRVSTRASHGAGKPTAKVIKADADLYAFLFLVFHMLLDPVTAHPVGGAE